MKSLTPPIPKFVNCFRCGRPLHKQRFPLGYCSVACMQAIHYPRKENP